MDPWSYDGLFYRRRPTRSVSVGDVTVGSRHPIRVQSMTTPSTRDVDATVEQIVRLVDAGCEIVRLTVPTTGDADSLPAIRSELHRRRIRVPLVADIHFTPAAAMKAVEHVEKIRINPGNYADKKKFRVHEYSDAQYAEELERIAEVFSPLVRRARELGVSMRIGTNHGSLSDRIMNRYGDTPEGMVESALEFVRICESHGYHELILSMKSSNPVVVQQVYRLLAQRMAESGMDYPFHLGVTEAGDGEDGRLKSALGIGGLLQEGIGDTVRVSLTEDPVAEIPVALALVAPYNRPTGADDDAGPGLPHALRRPVQEARDPFGYERRSAAELRIGPHRFGGKRPVLVEVPLCSPLSRISELREELDRQVGVRVPEETRAEVVSVQVHQTGELEHLRRLFRSMELVAPRCALSARIDGERLLRADESELRSWLSAVHRLQIALDGATAALALPAMQRALVHAAELQRTLLFELAVADAPRPDVEQAVDLAVELAGHDDGARGAFALRVPAPISPVKAYRLLAARLSEAELAPPLVLIDDSAARRDEPLLGPAQNLGSLLCDGIGDAVQLHAGSADASRRLAFGILQAARIRITRTEFISCPSCGRTLFDLEETTARIKRRTAHLKGLKIAVMGCIVNGPGEMADADFGYVGWGENKIALFVGKEMVEKDIPTDQADRRLVELIQQHGRWVDPPVPASERA